jgi:hypothetical protein
VCAIGSLWGVCLVIGVRHVVAGHMAPDYVCVVDTDGTGGVSCLVLYTQYERMALERIVGAKRCAQMIAGAKATFMFT